MSVYDWFTLDNGRSVYRRVERQERGPRSHLALPTIASDFSEPVQSMADGKWYTNKGALRSSYKAENNPQGVDYVEVGDDTSRTGPEQKRITKQECATLLDKYEAAVNRGEIS